MHTSIITVAALAALASAVPLPLNINLGAYSPALVVGDGAMSFEEANAVTSLVNTLQGAAVADAAAAAGNTNGAATPATAAPATTPSTAAGTAAAGTAAAGTAEKAPILNDQVRTMRLYPVPHSSRVY
jgi:hypothetical protein